MILMCEIGGTMTTSENFPVGKLSRSLKGAYILIAEGGLDMAKVSAPSACIHRIGLK